MTEELKILIVDDDDVDRMAVRRALKTGMPDAAIDQAASAAQAIEFLQTGDYDCALLDYMLPDGDGFSVLRSLHEAGIEIPVIMLTGQGDERLAVELLQAGASDYLPKSRMSPETLAHSMQNAMRLFEAEAERRRAEQELRVALEQNQQQLEALAAANVRATLLNETLGELQNADRELHHSGDLEAFYRRIIHDVMALTGACYGAFGVFNKDGAMQDFITEGMSEEQVRNIGQRPAGKGLLQAFYHEKIAVRIDSIAQDPRHYGFPPHHPPIHSLLGVPVVVNEATRGVIYLGDKHGGGTFSENEEIILDLYAKDVAHFLERDELWRTLQKAGAHLQYLVDNSPAIIYSAVPSGDFKITFVSENITRLLGHKPSEMLADPNFWFNHIHPDDRKPLFSELFTLFADKQQVQEYRFQRKDGGYCWIHDTLRVICNDKGEPVEVLGSLMDISERKQMEDELHAEKAEQQVLIKKLQEAQDQLLQSEKMASIGQLAAGVAHEINNPVGYISSNISTLQGYINNLIEMVNLYEISETGRRDDQEWMALLTSVKEKIDLDYLRDDIQDLIKESQEGVQRVKQIVQDLKDFSHVDEAEWQWVDLHKGLDSTLNVVNNELKYKAEVVKEYGELPAVECLASQLNQVFMNLLVNAAHAIEKQGTITVRTGTHNDGVWVEVEDTGKGMDAETQRKIFDPFFTTKPVGKGTGLGLSLSYGIIQKHNGTITVESEAGKGTRFHVWLPVKQQPDTSSDLQEEGDVDSTSQAAIK